MNRLSVFPIFFMFLALAGFTSCSSSESSGDGGGALYGSNPAAGIPDEEEEPEEQEPERLVEISTDFGVMKVKLYNSTPRHRDNFLKLAEEGFYDGTLFHRVIAGFMIQGGDPDSKTAEPGQRLGQGGPGYTVPAEIRRGNIHKKGALSAARLSDAVNPRRESSGSQFYIVEGNKFTSENFSAFETNRTYSAAEKQAYFDVGGYPGLDGQYTVFGEVIEGLGIIDEIARVRKDPNDRPLEDISMTVRVLDEVVE